jgi:hypothetical protein
VVRVPLVGSPASTRTPCASRSSPSPRKHSMTTCQNAHSAVRPTMLGANGPLISPRNRPPAVGLLAMA